MRYHAIYPIPETEMTRPVIGTRTSCSASQELNHYTTAAPDIFTEELYVTYGDDKKRSVL